MRESTIRAFLQIYRTGYSPITGLGTRSFGSRLGTRLDIILFRMRFLPTIYSCHQFVRHIGVSVNGALSYAPQSHLTVGDVVGLVSPSANATTRVSI
jgi:ribosomal protein S4